MEGSIAIDPVDPNVIYLDDRYGAPGLFKSSNGASTGQRSYPPTCPRVHLRRSGGVDLDGSRRPAASHRQPALQLHGKPRAQLHARNDGTAARAGGSSTTRRSRRSSAGR